jgi:hypothetical protein
LEFYFMERLRKRASFIVGVLLSLPGLADTGKSCAAPGTCNYTPQTPNTVSGGNLGAYQPGYVPGGGMGGGPSPEDLAKKEKAEQEGKKKYCKDNGYPANVPFCAAFKQQAIESCKDGVNQRYDLALFDANERMISSYSDCNNTYSAEFLASLTACIDQATDHFDGAINGIEADKKNRLGNCSNM